MQQPLEGRLHRICHSNLMHANLCRWPHYCREMDCLINHIIQHICRLADQIEAVFFEQIPFVKFVRAHGAAVALGQSEEEVGSLVYEAKVVPNLESFFWRWGHFSIFSSKWKKILHIPECYLVFLCLLGQTKWQQCVATVAGTLSHLKVQLLINLGLASPCQITLEERLSGFFLNLFTFFVPVSI